MSSRFRDRLAPRRPVLLAAGLLLACGAASCDRGPRELRQAAPPGGARAEGVRQVPLRPGIPTGQPDRTNPYAGNVLALEEGRRLYHWMNCSGCHFAGGGGIGPPLMDDDWIYGGRPDQIFDSVANGRANGMPAYGDKLAADQIWQIVAYVETLGGERGGDAE